MLLDLMQCNSSSMTVFAHERQLLTIGGKPVLLVVGSTNEPVYVGDSKHSGSVTHIELP